MNSCWAVKQKRKITIRVSTASSMRVPAPSGLESPTCTKPPALRHGKVGGYLPADISSPLVRWLSIHLVAVSAAPGVPVRD